MKKIIAVNLLPLSVIGCALLGVASLNIHVILLLVIIVFGSQLQQNPLLLVLLVAALFFFNFGAFPPILPV
jgi:hypothetical protein